MMCSTQVRNISVLAGDLIRPSTGSHVCQTHTAHGTLPAHLTKPKSTKQAAQSSISHQNQGTHCSHRRHRHIIASCCSPAPLLGQHLAAQLGGNVLDQISGVRNVLASCSCLMCAATGTSHQAIGDKQPDHNINQSHWRACRSMGLLGQPLDWGHSEDLAQQPIAQSPSVT